MDLARTTSVPDARDPATQNAPRVPVRLTLLSGLLAMVCACSSIEAKNGLIECTEPRPEICTMDYTPVCALRSVSGTDQWKTYSNACSACADATVSGYRKDACPSDD